jgi:dihydrofolate reductase
MLYSIILACTLEGGIGYNNIIPWDIKSELYLFKQITTGCVDNFKSNAVIMGRKTWESYNYYKRC